MGGAGVGRLQDEIWMEQGGGSGVWSVDVAGREWLV